MSYLVEQPPHCDLLRLSLSTGRFVLFGRTTSANTSRSRRLTSISSVCPAWAVGSVSLFTETLGPGSRYFLWTFFKRSAPCLSSLRRGVGRYFLWTFLKDPASSLSAAAWLAACLHEPVMPGRDRLASLKSSLSPRRSAADRLAACLHGRPGGILGLKFLQVQLSHRPGGLVPCEL